MYTDYVEHVDSVVEEVQAAVVVNMNYLSNEAAVRHSDTSGDYTAAAAAAVVVVVVATLDIEGTMMHAVVVVVQNCLDTSMVPLDRSYCYW
jgi:hypothetical protein